MEVNFVEEFHFISMKKLEKDLKEIAPKVLPFMGPVWKTLDKLKRQGKHKGSGTTGNEINFNGHY